MTKKINTPVHRRSEYSLSDWLKARAVGKGRGNSDRNKFIPFMNFLYCLEEQEESLDQILRVIDSAKKMERRTIKQVSSVNKLSTDLNEIYKEEKLNSQLVSSRDVQNVFSGSLFIILNSLLQSMASRVHLRSGRVRVVVAGRQIGRTSLFELIVAASNNFRHFEEWSQKNSKNNNICILRAAGIKRPWNRNLCGEVFRKIDWKNVESLSLEIRLLGKEIFEYQSGIKLDQ